MLRTINDGHKAVFNYKNHVMCALENSDKADDKNDDIMEPYIIEADIVEISKEALELNKPDPLAMHDEYEITSTEAEEQSPLLEITELFQNRDETKTESKGKIGINVAKLARKLAAAKTRSQVQKIISEIKQDLKECEAGKMQGMDVDKASVQAAKHLLGRAKQCLAKADNREPTPDEEAAFSLAGLI